LFFVLLAADVPARYVDALATSHHDDRHGRAPLSYRTRNKRTLGAAPLLTVA